MKKFIKRLIRDYKVWRWNRWYDKYGKEIAEIAYQNAKLREEIRELEKQTGIKYPRNRILGQKWGVRKK